MYSTWTHLVIDPLPPVCRDDRRVIVMTFWYVCWNGLNFFELFKLLFSLGIDHDPPRSLCSHDLCLFPFLYVSFFTRYNGQEKSLSYYDLFDFGVLLIYGRIPTLILPFFLLNRTTPILAIEVLIIRTNLKKDSSRTRRVEIRQIPTVRQRTMFGPD